MKNNVVYHAYLEGMTINEGYIGVTNNYKSRKDQHLYVSKHLMKVPKFKRICLKYNKEILWKILLVGSFDYCNQVEGILRPTPNIGWNTAKGGTRKIK